MLFTVRPGLNGYKDARLVAYYEELQRRIAALPQVRSVTFSRRSPIGGGTSSGLASIRGITKPGERPNLRRHEVAPRYFETLDIPILSGRSIGAEDVRSATHVAVVSQALVTRYFGGADPIGRVLDFGGAAKSNALSGLPA